MTTSFTWHNKRRWVPCDADIHSVRVQEMEIIRKEEMEAMKIEEITSGGFIPPQADVEAASFDVAPER
jgi:hypothetical protein